MRKILLIMLAMTIAGTAQAAESGNDGDRQQRLDDAHHRLEAAAEEIARLTSDINRHAFGNFSIEISHRAMLGINIGPPHDQRAEGVEVLGVSPGGPAQEAGLQQGDLLLALDGKALAGQRNSDPHHTLLEHLQNIEPGTEVKVRYRRGDEENEIAVTTTGLAPALPVFVGNVPVAPGLPGHPGPHDFDLLLPPLQFGVFHQWGNMEIVSLTPGLGEYFGTDTGILVVRAPETNPLALEDGDVIKKIGDRTPSDAGQVMRILHSYDSGETVSLEILRHKRKRTLSAEVPETPDSYHSRQGHKLSS